MILAGSAFRFGFKHLVFLALLGIVAPGQGEAPRAGGRAFNRLS
jgi:hypothetical protein